MAAERRHPADAFYLHVKADRDLALFGVVVALAIYRRPAPLALMVAATCIAPVIDAALVATAPHRGLGYALGGQRRRHLGFRTNRYAVPNCTAEARRRQQ